MKIESKSRTWVQFAVIFYFALFSIVVFQYTLSKPLYNFDMIAYVGSVKNFETDNKQAIHDFAYTEISRSIDSESFNRLTTSSKYRQIVYEDAESFSQILPWYQIRPMYTGLLYVLYKAGINIVFASHLISAVAVLLGVWIFYLSFRRYIASTLWLAIPFFILLTGTTEVARFSSPDGLAFLWVSLLTFLFLNHSKFLIWLLPLSILVRTDLIFLVALFLAYLFWASSKEGANPLKKQKIRIEKKSISTTSMQKIRSVMALLASLIIYLTINGIYGNYGWATVFHLVFVEPLNYPADTVVRIEIIQYVNAVSRGLVNLLIDDRFDAYAGFFLLHIAILLQLTLKGLRSNLAVIMNQRINAIAAISFIYVVVHFLIFPDGLARFFAAQYLTGLLAFLAIVSSVSRLLSPNNPEAS